MVKHMETASKYQVLDIGGGPDWNPNLGHGDWLINVMRNLRTTELARKNPKILYIVLDINIPRPETQILLKELPNLRFIEYKITESIALPFSDMSVERVEMNHMWTPLTARPSYEMGSEIKGILGARDYLHVLKESCRVLKLGGILSITEKEDGLKNIRYILSKNRDLDLDGMFMQELGLSMNPETQTLTEVTDPNRSQFTYLTLKQGVKVYCLELTKK